MDEFEDRLRQLKLRGPSAELDRRVAEALEGAASPTGRVRRAIGIPWAVAAALAMGLIGFGAGRFGGSGGQTTSVPEMAAPSVPAVRVEILYKSGPAMNPFDLTTASDDSLKPPMSIAVQPEA